MNRKQLEQALLREPKQRKVKVIQYVSNLERLENSFKFFLLDLHEWRNKLAYNVGMAESVDTQEFLEMKSNLRMLNAVIGKAKKVMDFDIQNTIKISSNKEYYKLEEE